jgi:hypothetical protein
MNKPVYLLGCPAEISVSNGRGGWEHFPVSLIGLFDVIEYMPYEPSNYVFSPLYLVVPAGTDDEDETMYTVNALDMQKQVDPKSWARELVQEREMEWAAERDWV